MNKLVLIVVGIVSFSCKSIHSVNNRNALSVTIDTLLQDKISIRALVLNNDKMWYAADQSRFGYIDLKTNQKKQIKWVVIGFVSAITIFAFSERNCTKLPPFTKP